MIRQSVLKLALAGAEHIVLINARLVQRNSRGTAMIRQHVVVLEEAGANQRAGLLMLQQPQAAGVVIPVPHAEKTSLGIALIKTLV